MNRSHRMRETLAAAFGDAGVTILDESAQHAGHAGAQPGGQTHYRVRIVSAQFAGLTRVARHRLVNAALKTEFDDGLHALALTTLTPDENRRA